jgi:circadian clock protein KaiB
MKDSVCFKFELYVAAQASNSAQAVANLRQICRTHLPRRHEIEVVDVFEQPARALAKKIFMTPTLVLVSPDPVRRLVGNLSDTPVVLQTLGLEESAGA